LRHFRAERDWNDEPHLQIQNRADDLSAPACLALGPSFARIEFGARERSKE
jgi:hypothetical protein